MAQKDFNRYGEGDIMKYIASYPRQPRNAQLCAQADKNDYYHTSHGWCNGNSLGVFRKKEGGVWQGTHYDEGVVIETPWLKKVAEDLLDHLQRKDLSMGAGYCAFLSDDKNAVLAETYTACSGNTVVVIHKNDMSILYVDSARHGIPCLARDFMELEAIEVLMYDSWRTDTPWYAAGLAPYTDKNGVDYWPEEGQEDPVHQDEWEEIERRLVA